MRNLNDIVTQREVFNKSYRLLRHQCDQVLEYKSCLNVSKSCLNEKHCCVFHKFFFKKIAQKVPIILGYFCKQFCYQELSKIAQSGHTVRHPRASLEESFSIFCTFIENPEANLPQGRLTKRCLLPRYSNSLFVMLFGCPNPTDSRGERKLTYFARAMLLGTSETRFSEILNILRNHFLGFGRLLALF